MQHWELLCPGGLSFVCDDGLFQPSTDSFLLGSFPRLKPGLRVCDLGSGTGLLGLLLFQRQRALSVTGVELLPDAVRLAEQAAARLRLDRRDMRIFLLLGKYHTRNACDDKRLLCRQIGYGKRSVRGRYNRCNA